MHESLQQKLVKTFNNKTAYEMQAEEIDNEEENAGNVIQPEQSQVLHQEENKYLIQKNTTLASKDNNDEELWKTRAQKNTDDFDAYSNFMNSKFGSAPVIEKAKVVEVKKDNVTQNSAVQ